MQGNLIDLKGLLNSRLLKSEWFGGLSKQLTDYEKKVKTVVHELDLKSRDARVKSRKQLDQFASQVRKTKVELEKTVVALVNKEAQKLTKGFNELVGYLKVLSQREEILAKKAKAVGGSKSKSKKAKATGTKRSTAGKNKKKVM